MADDQVNVKISAHTAGFDGPVRSAAATAEQSFGRIRVAANGASISLNQLGESARAQLAQATGQIRTAARNANAHSIAGLPKRVELTDQLTQLEYPGITATETMAPEALIAGTGRSEANFRRPLVRSAGGGPDSAAEVEREAREQAEIFAAGERLKIQEAKGSTDEIERIYVDWLAEVASVYGKDSTQYLNLEREKVAAAQRAAEQRAQAVEEWARQQAEAEMRAAEDAQRAWKDATKQVSDQIANLVADLLTRTKTISEVFRQLTSDIVKDFASSSIKSLLMGSSGGENLSTALFGETGLSGLLGLGPRGLFGSLFGGFFGGGAVDAAAQDFSGGVAGAATGGSLFSGLSGWLGSLFAFGKGGIVPSAAGGWMVPNTTLAMLHTNEMVLPAHISQGLQNMIAGGGAATPNVTFAVSAIDSASVANFFKSNGAALVAGINYALRNGSSLMSTA
ncbi:MAG: hypothetical protein JO081_14430 [Alphaproteobacteria bacterium]|nr:hypothetical protein [Alphaproteobacteria bacterium]